MTAPPNKTAQLIIASDGGDMDGLIKKLSIVDLPGAKVLSINIYLRDGQRVVLYPETRDHLQGGLAVISQLAVRDATVAVEIPRTLLMGLLEPADA